MLDRSINDSIFKICKYNSGFFFLFVFQVFASYVLISTCEVLTHSRLLCLLAELASYHSMTLLIPDYQSLLFFFFNYCPYSSFLLFDVSLVYFSVLLLRMCLSLKLVAYRQHLVGCISFCSVHRDSLFRRVRLDRPCAVTVHVVALLSLSVRNWFVFIAFSFVFF